MMRQQETRSVERRAEDGVLDFESESLVGEGSNDGELKAGRGWKDDGLDGSRIL